MPVLYKSGPAGSGAIRRLADNTDIPIPGGGEPPSPDYAQFQALYAADSSILAPADPLPTVYARGRPLDERRVRTTSATPAEIFRAPVPQNTAYKALLTIWGITDDLANVRVIEATVIVGRAANGVAVVQTRVSPANATVKADHAIGTGGAWPLPTIAVDNTGSIRDVVIRVTGPASPAVNWMMTGSFETFTPLGGA